MSWLDNIEHMPLDTLQWHELNWERWSETDKEALFLELKTVVPKETIRHELDEETRWIRPNNPEIANNPFLIWGAMLLNLGELEAHVRPLPPTSVEDWEELKIEIREKLETISSDVSSDTELTAAHHAKLAIQFIDALETQSNFVLHEAQNAHERSWVEEVIAIAAHHGYAIGRRSQAALYKPFQKAAGTGSKVRRGLDGNRQVQIEKSQRAATARRARITEIMAKTHLKGRGLYLHIQRILGAESVSNISLDTIKKDITKIRKARKAG